MFETYIKSLQKESDRGCVLIGAELLSNSLQTRLEYTMQGGKKLKKELLTGLGPVSTFSAKIKICYCFRVISKSTYNELNHLRAIRNIAAHSIEGFSFGNEEVKKHLASMQYLKNTLSKIENGDFTEEFINLEMRKTIVTLRQNSFISDRAKYNFTVALLHGMLDQRE